ncbi:hypothetical protein CLV68_4078 [Actinokineospora cianjurensis]|uniref:Uncharacterized protein n=1 Tax=Actinokineospora cianjurensis TaxID=585224 RepID=A0A421B0V0_9PSEU|nr:hypothetical protein CLV68_4078 [Actinokineospora cianjurensis]
MSPGNTTGRHMPQGPNRTLGRPADGNSPAVVRWARTAGRGVAGPVSGQSQPVALVAVTGFVVYGHWKPIQRNRGQVCAHERTGSRQTRNS